MSYNITSPSFNLTNPENFDPNLCTLDTCPLAYATVNYDPTLAGNALYTAIFGLLLFVHVYLGIRSRTWGYFGAIFGGLVLEIIGYAARVEMHYNPFLANPFLIYIICLTIAPCFFSAAIYVCLSRIITMYGSEYARFRPRTYTIMFICSDVFSLILQATGGALADTANTQQAEFQGIDIMIAGLAFQVFSLTVFVALCADYAWRLCKARSSRTPARLPCTKARFHIFVMAIALAILTIYIRSCFRVAELQGGFGGPLANEEIPFMILEGAMIIIASTALTVGHPGVIFGAKWGIAKMASNSSETSAEQLDHESKT